VHDFASQPTVEESLKNLVRDQQSRASASVAGAGEALKLAHEALVMMRGMSDGAGNALISQAIDSVSAALAARPVADGEAAKLADEIKRLFDEMWASPKGSLTDWGHEKLIDRLAALARQAPAPLSQAVPVGQVLRRISTHGPVTSAFIFEAFHHLEPGTPLYTEAQPQAVTEDARDGERLDAVMNAAAGMLPDGYEVRVCVERHAGWVELLNDEADNVAPTFDGDHTLSEQVVICVQKAIAGAARAATSGSEGEGR
jgi:hypothetical protein